MNKYLKFYYIDTLLVIILILLGLFLDLDQVDFYGLFGSGSFPVVPTFFIILSIISLVINVICHSSRTYIFDETSMLFPKYYLMFYILMIILGLIYNQFALVKGLHIMYYFTFIIGGYFLLSLYTTFSFKKQKVKKVRKKNK